MSPPPIRRARADELPVVVRLLAASGLPTEDLSAANDLRLWLALDHDVPVGVIGLERFGAEGLLRSLAVAVGHRKLGLGHELIAQLERDARADGMARLVLLTETAEPFFRQLGFKAIDRAAVSEPVKRSAEFRALCPASATCMGKSLLE